MGELVSLDHTGDTKITWDKNKPEEVAVAEKSFDELKKKGYSAFAVKKKEKTNEALTKFDPALEKIIMIPQMRGG